MNAAFTANTLESFFWLGFLIRMLCPLLNAIESGFPFFVITASSITCFPLVSVCVSYKQNLPSMSSAAGFLPPLSDMFQGACTAVAIYPIPTRVLFIWFPCFLNQNVELQ